MRIVAAVILISFCLVSFGCGVPLQPSVQGEWANFHSDKHKVSADVRKEAAKPPAER